MQMKFNDLIKTAFIEYIKSHNEFEGKITEFSNHIIEAGEVFYSLPESIQNDLLKFILSDLALSGIKVAIPLNN